MATAVQAFRIQNLEARIGLRHCVCASLELQAEAALTGEERALLLRQRQQALKEYIGLSLILERLKRNQE